MRSCILFFTLLACIQPPVRGRSQPAVPASSPVVQDWDYQTLARTPEAWNGLIVTSPDPANIADHTPDGSPSLHVVTGYGIDELQWPSHLVYPVDASRLSPDTRQVTVRFWIKGESGIKISLRITNSRARPLSATRSWTLDGDWQQITFDEPLTSSLSTAGSWLSAPRLILEKCDAGQHILVGPLTATFIPSPPLSTPAAAPAAPVAASRSAAWLPLDTSDLYVRAGTALDYTPFAGTAPAGAYGRVIVNRRGELAFASQPDIPVRFLSVQWMPPRYEFPNLTDEQIAAFADAIARQGYNMVRFHFLDNFINANNKAAALKKPPSRYVLPENPDEIRWDPKALDRTHRFFAELKKRGIYWNLDFMTSFVGYTNGAVLQQTGAVTRNPFNTKVQLYVNANFRANWRAAVTRLLNDINPYTGLSLKDDPALALASCLNEQEILIPHRKYGRELDPAWHKYLKNKYTTYTALHAAWDGQCGDTPLPPPPADDSASRDAFTLVPSINEIALTDTPAGRDMARACGEMESEVSLFYLNTLRELGFTGLVSNWNMRTRIGTVPARSLFPVITMNAYHAHPQFGTRTKADQRSALAAGGNSFKGQALARLLDRPFANTEYGLVFWNPWRHEQGLLYGAGAALQGWSALTCHAEPVVQTGSPLLWFHAGDDPVIRASETVAAYAFRRGDIAPSPHTIEIPLTDDFIYNGGRALGAIDDELSRLWALCRVGITYGQKRHDYPKDLSVSPDKTSSISGSQMFSTVADSTSTARLAAIARQLRNRKILTPDNVTDPASGILQSDTRQVTLDTSPSARGELHVRSPRLEGSVLKTGHPQKLDALTIDRCTTPASVTLLSIDPDTTRNLRTARRLLLVFSTDARNSDMKFANATEDTLVDLGTLPVLVRTGQLGITLDRATAVRPRAWALNLNGTRAAEIPVDIGTFPAGARLTLAIDTANPTSAGPTPFYEIEFPQTPEN
ncbi:hypothetical protein OPIT5_24390 [Opitutaceae bacterium TAV5]|nr:hypothetical protein OPIT5_24390 [Opitutaceae bacterium TAV5]